MTNPRDLERADAPSPTPRERQGERPPSGTSLRDDAVAVVIGINTYHDPKIRNLQCARADAQAVYDVLTDPLVGRFKPQNVMLLLDEQATERRIRSALGTQLPRRAPKDGTVVIYYAGHGAPVIAPGSGSDGIAKYLVPHDAVADDLESSAIPMTRIQEYFQRLATSQVICFLDSCYSGGAGGRSFEYGDVQFRAALTDEFLESLGNAGRFVVTSCATNEVSLESNTLGHGVFTYFLVKGLQGAADTDEDGKVTIDELYTYVYNNVEQEARALGGSMNPLRKGSVSGTVYLTEFESADRRAARLANSAGESAWDRGDLAEAEAQWQAVLRLVPGHERATFGLEAITQQRAREEAERIQKENAREEELRPKRKKLLSLSNSNAITMREFDEAMTLLEQDLSGMGPRERSLRRYLDSLLSGELSVRAYRQSSALLDSESVAEAPSTAPVARVRDMVAPSLPAPVASQPSRAPTQTAQPLVNVPRTRGSAGIARWMIGAAMAGAAIVAYLVFRQPDPILMQEASVPEQESQVAMTPAPGVDTRTGSLASAWASLATSSCDETESHSYIPNEIRDYACRFTRSVGLSALQALAGVPVFVSGPHKPDALNLESYRFGHYNPRFVTWAADNLVPTADQLPPAVLKDLRAAATRYYEVNQWFDKHPDVLRRVSVAYARAVDAAPAEPSPGDNAGQGPAADVIYQNPNLRGATGDDWNKTIAAGFWVRRNLDETRPLFAAALGKLLTAIDPTFRPAAATSVRVDRPTVVHQLASGRGAGGGAIAVSPDGRQVAMGSNGTWLKAWNVETGAQLFSARLSDRAGGASGVAYSPDGRLIAATNYSNIVRVLDAKTGAIRFTRGDEGQGNYLTVAFMPDGKSVLTGGTDGTLHVWNATSGELLRSQKVHQSNVWAVAVSPDGRIVATGSADGVLALFNASDFSALASLPGGKPMRLAFNPAGTALAVGFYDRRVSLIAMPERNVTGSIATSSYVNGLAWKADGSQLAIASGDSVLVVDGSTLNRRYAIAAPDAKGVAWTPDGTRLAIMQENATTVWAVPR